MQSAKSCPCPAEDSVCRAAATGHAVRSADAVAHEPRQTPHPPLDAGLDRLLDQGRFHWPEFTKAPDAKDEKEQRKGSRAHSSGDSVRVL
jgi:hypothetical protein